MSWFMEHQRDRRLKVLYLDTDKLLYLFNRINPYMICTVPLINLPDNCKIVYAGYFGERQCWGIVLCHPAFSEVKLGDMIPALEYDQAVFEMVKVCKKCSQKIKYGTNHSCGQQSVIDIKQLQLKPDFLFSSKEETSDTLDFKGILHSDNPLTVDSKGCKKLCPNCNKELEYFEYVCPRCRYDFT